MQVVRTRLVTYLGYDACREATGPKYSSAGAHIIVSTLLTHSTAVRGQLKLILVRYMNQLSVMIMHRHCQQHQDAGRAVNLTNFCMQGCVGPLPEC